MTNSSLDDYQQLIEYDKKHLIVLLKTIVDIHYFNFQQTEIYSKLPDLTFILNYIDQNILIKEVRNHFETFIYNLSKLCPKISSAEILVCCPSFRFSMQKIALCFGYTSTNAIRQHKFRIRNKLTAGVDNSFLFDFIFKTKYF